MPDILLFAGRPLRTAQMQMALHYGNTSQGYVNIARCGTRLPNDEAGTHFAW